MQKKITISLHPFEAGDEKIVKTKIAFSSGALAASVSGYNILKKSIDARGKQPRINLLVEAFINEPWRKRELMSFQFRDVQKSPCKVIIIGAGPAGLFAALRLIEAGIKPVILERGKEVRSRRRDLALLNKKGILNPESNYCFGEGGAGTYSDGKLYTRSTKRGDVNRILNLFVHFGADENILYDSHPHIGTNKLPHIITGISKRILDCGGEIYFEQRITDLKIRTNRLTGVKTSDGNIFEADATILATGHSARDIFHLLYNKGIEIEEKPFALGVRVEHPQELINSIQYHCPPGTCDPNLPPASYSLVNQFGDTGIFSFCMCPGGIIAPAATSEGELVVNGWSPSKRNNPYANSGIVVQVKKNQLLSAKGNNSGRSSKDFEKVMELPQKILTSPLGMMYFQQYVERKAFAAGGGKFVAPAQRLVDYCENKISTTLPDCSYLPGIHSASLAEVLPEFIHWNLQQAFREFGRKMPGRYGTGGYLTNEAIVVATESRTSSPVRIPRDIETLQHPGVAGLYPCGEGAGYAGGIVSAAMDGERIAEKIALRFQKLLSS